MTSCPPRGTWARARGGGGCLQLGLLSRHRPTAGMKYDYRDAPPALVSRARAIAEVCAAHGTTLPAAAIAFPYTHPSIINVTLGMRTPEQVGRNVELHDQQVPDGLWDDLRTQGLIRSDVLTGHGGGGMNGVSDGQGHRADA